MSTWNGITMDATISENSNAQAFHLFLQQSINVGGLPFLVVRDGGETLRREAERRLFDAIREGEDSAARSGWVSEQDALAEFGGGP